jgi:ribosomal protein L21E
MTHKYSIGERVRIKKDLKGYLYYGGTPFNPDMAKYCGKIGTVKRFKGSDYELNVDGRTAKDKYIWQWSDEMLEPVTKSLEELEVGQILTDRRGIKRKVIQKGYELERLDDGTTVTWPISDMKISEIRLYTPKKITVFKHKGKRYPVEQIIKNVKPL